MEIAKQTYSVATIVQLIHKPSAEYWPGYAARLPPMALVPNAELSTIADWFNSVVKG